MLRGVTGTPTLLVSRGGAGFVDIQTGGIVSLSGDTAEVLIQTLEFPACARYPQSMNWIGA